MKRKNPTTTSTVAAVSSGGGEGEGSNASTGSDESKGEMKGSSSRSSMQPPLLNHVVFPGDPISLPPNTKTRIGAGLVQDKSSVGWIMPYFGPHTHAPI
jgi:hypothetical protein